MQNDIDAPVFTMCAAAQLCGVAIDKFRAWWARAPDRRLGVRAGRAWLFTRRELYTIALWGTLLNHGHGPPHLALKTARLVAGHRGPTVFVSRDGDEIAVSSEPPAAASVAIPTTEIWRRVQAAKET